MKEFNFNVKDRTLTLNGDGKFIGHNGDYIAVFSFDDEWNGKSKIARFKKDKFFRDVALDNDRCSIPSDMLKKGRVKIGVYNDEMKSEPLTLEVVESIFDGKFQSASASKDSTLGTVVLRLMDKVDSLSPIPDSVLTTLLD
mgnify:FL=1